MASRSFSWSRRKSSRHAKRALHFSRQQNRPLGFARLAIEALEERVLLSLGQPALFTPVNTASGLVSQPQFSWSEVPGNSGYRLIVSSASSDMQTAPNYSGGLQGSGFITTVADSAYPHFTPSTALSPNTTYYWEVQAIGGPWSGSESFTTAPSATPTVSGIDVSGAQGTIDWATLHGNGIGFAFIEATQGTSSTDPEFSSNISNAMAAGVPVGAYHVADPSADAVLATDPSNTAELLADADAEAKYFCSVAGSSLVSAGLEPVLDLEPGGGQQQFQLSRNRRVGRRMAEGGPKPSPRHATHCPYERNVCRGFRRNSCRRENLVGAIPSVGCRPQRESGLLAQGRTVGLLGCYAVLEQ